MQEPGSERPSVTRNSLNPDTGSTTVTKNNPSVGTRFLALAGPAIVLLATTFSLATGTGVRLLRGAWFCAALWTSLTALSCVL